MVRRVSLPRRSPRWLELPMRIGTRAEARQESLSTRRSGWREPCTRTLLSEPMTPEELVQEFTARQPYQLDDFQLDAIRALANRHSVLVAAPTGTGKTVVGEFGIFMARKYGTRAIYTTPIKALSNQKFREFRLRWGDDEVGLLTGDVVVHREAPTLVMTTEVLRNMLVTGGSLADVGAIVFDEVHYMGDPERGMAWEEAILLALREVPLVCLSATVPNAGEIAEWIREAHGELSCVFHDQRSVPLEHRYWLPDPQLRPTAAASPDPQSRSTAVSARAAEAKRPGFSVVTVLDADDRVTPAVTRLRHVGGELAGRV